MIKDILIKTVKYQVITTLIEQSLIDNQTFLCCIIPLLLWDILYYENFSTTAAV